MTITQYSHDPTAVVGRRFGAYVIDMLLIPLVLAVVPLVVFFATADLTEYTGGPPCEVLVEENLSSSSNFCLEEVQTSNTQADADHSTVVFKKSSLWVSLGLFGGLHLIYTVGILWFVQASTGATAGKALFGIRTVDEAGGPPGVGKQFIRGILWLVDGLTICGVPLIAILTILMSKGHRRLGDMAAKTYVVGTADTGSPILVPQAGGVVAAPAPGAGYNRYGTAPSGPPSYEPNPHEAGYAAPTAGGAPSQSQPGAADQPDAGTSPTSPRPTQASGPQWDPERNAYIYWDASRSAWLIHDAASGEWKPLT